MIEVAGGALGLALLEGLVLALGETLGLIETEGLTLALGLTDGDTDGLGEALNDGLILGEVLWLGLAEALGEADLLGDTLGLILLLGLPDAEGETEPEGLTDGEPANAVRISIIPTIVGEALDRVNAAEAVEPVALNGWSAQLIPSPSIRSVQPVGEVKVGTPSATQVTFMVDLTAVRESASQVLVVDEAFSRRFTAPMGVV